MNTQLRSWYLSSLGIVPYISRDAAQVSHSIEAGTALAEPSLPEKPAGKAAARPRVALDFDTTAEGSPKLKSSVSTSAEQPPKELPNESGQSSSAVEQVAPFRLACWQPCDDLLVIDSLEPGEQPGLERTQLLSNILVAINRGTDQLGSAELIDWPTSPATSGSPPTEDGARALISVFLDIRIKQRGVCWVLLMGESAAAYTGDKQAEFAVGQQRELSGGARAVLTHSLKSLLVNPAGKAETWQAIRFLAEQ